MQMKTSLTQPINLNSMKHFSPLHSSTGLQGDNLHIRRTPVNG